MPKMAESESKEETAESIAEKKEQVILSKYFFANLSHYFNVGKTKTIGSKTEGERKEWKIYKIENSSQRWSCKVQRKGWIFPWICKIVNNELLVQYKLDASPTPSDEEDMTSDEEDAFGPKKEKVEEDPVKSKIFKKKANVPIYYKVS